MTPFRRLLSCLCVLALLAGAQVQARAAMAHDHAHAAQVAEATGPDMGDCHGSSETAAVPDRNDDATGTMDCCGDKPGSAGCDSGCACATTTATAAMVPPHTAALAMLHASWSPTGRVGRAGPADGPPTPPPRH